jgi:hypothetical protein
MKTIEVSGEIPPGFAGDALLRVASQLGSRFHGFVFAPTAIRLTRPTDGKQFHYVCTGTGDEVRFDSSIQQ